MVNGGAGSSFADPIYIYSSSQSIRASQTSQSASQQHGVLPQTSQHPPSSQSAGAEAGPPSSQLASASDSVFAGPGATQRFRWTPQNEYDFVKAIKDNVAYQALLLPGHSKSKAVGGTASSSGGALSASSAARTISLHIFGPSDQKSAAQMKQKLRGIVSQYQAALKTESKTGQGLLLTEMRGGELKTLREQIL
ncbi:hypothetical protein OC844_007612 [Tilletia horrida]|nr:hypothetical protein OC844_007612 [Tilletia horrida]